MKTIKRDKNFGKLLNAVSLDIACWSFDNGPDFLYSLIQKYHGKHLGDGDLQKQSDFLLNQIIHYPNDVDVLAYDLIKKYDLSFDKKSVFKKVSNYLKGK
jgi:hypothetical protein